MSRAWTIVVFGLVEKRFLKCFGACKNRGSYEACMIPIWGYLNLEKPYDVLNTILPLKYKVDRDLSFYDALTLGFKCGGHNFVSSSSSLSANPGIIVHPPVRKIFCDISLRMSIPQSYANNYTHTFVVV